MRKDTLRFLNENFTAVVATTYKGLVYASTIYYVADKKYNIYFVTNKNTEKYHNLEKNKNIAYVVNDGAKPVAVHARGFVERLRGKDKRDILARFDQLYKQKKIEIVPLKKIRRLQPKKNKKFNPVVVYRIRPLHLNFLNLGDKRYQNSVSDDVHTVVPQIINQNATINTAQGPWHC